MNHTDHEIEMARSELYSIAKYAIALHEMLENVSELEGMEGWQQSKITKAADYMESVYQSLTHEMKFGESDTEDVSEAEKKGLYYYVNKRKKAGTSRDASSPKAPSPQDWKNAAKTAKKESVEEAGYGRNKGYAPGFASPTAPPLRPVGGPKQDDEYHVPDPVASTYYIRANGKIIKDKMGTPFQFRDKESALKAAQTMMAKPFNAGKKFMLTTKPEDDAPATNESVEENKKGVRAVKHTTKPRNPVMAGDKPGKATITHKNKKKDAERGVEKHKGKEPAYESRLWNALSNHLEK